MADLIRTSPASRGVDAAGISALLDRLADMELHSLMVLRGGAVIAEGWWAPYSPDRVHLLYSLSKTFTASCVGMLVDDGLVELDRPVVDYLPSVPREAVAEPYRRVTVRHCLNMATGHLDDNGADAAEAPAQPDPQLLAILAEPPQAEPGSVFQYNQRATYLLGALVREVSGQSLLGFARRRLLDPLGISQVRWHDTPTGRELGYSGLHATTEAIARLGLLWLGRGEFEGRRLLSEAWFDAATDFPPLSNPQAGDWERGYGFQVWNQRHGYRGDGAFGQYLVILPEHDAVVAITSETSEMQQVLTALWDCLVPAFDAAGSAAADLALARRLAEARIPALASFAQPGPLAYRRVGGDVAEDWADIALNPIDGGWELRFAGVADPILVGDGHWVESRLRRGAVTLPVVASGGWVDGGFAADLRFIESPHRVRITPSGDGVEVAWQLCPLGGSDPFQLARSVVG